VHIFSGSIGDTLVRALFAEQRLDDIARYWVKGANIHWTAIDRAPGARRVPLPAYPFKPIQVWQAQDNVAPPAVAGETPIVPVSADRSGDEDRIQTIMMAVLGLSAREWDFDRTLADYGLNSLLLITMLGQIRRHYPGFRSEWIKPHHTARDVVLRLADLGAAPSTSRDIVKPAQVFPELIQLNTRSLGQPVFWIHGALGSVETYQTIADRSDRPFYAIQARGFMTAHEPMNGVQAMAAYYIQAIRSIQAQGPYDIGGFCLGGIIAYEMARQLQEQGQTVDTLVMVDSPDNTAFQSAAPQNIPLKNAALQVTNILLWPPGEYDLTTITERMISQDEVNTESTDDDFIRRLAELAVERGLTMRQDRIEAFIRQNMAVQVGYRLHEFRILPLPRPDEVRCAYFRNRQGLFYGELGPYFTTAGDGFSLDNVVYWQDWQREIEHFRMVDIDASNHMTILFENHSLEAIVDVCEELYASDALETCA
jgi:thioesterase domain-containing protein